ncbi:MAG: hypothetical protein HYS80_00690 [Candidatus Aenigmarchaeota archaeon]|nr:hypothetical protein [Candidatus Aenigmarchaeota archaeon]
MTNEDDVISDIWEPWQPELDQTVRFRYSQECPWYRSNGSGGWSHTPYYQGITGAVTYIGKPKSHGAHRFCIKTEYGDFFCAAIELTPVESDRS